MYIKQGNKTRIVSLSFSPIFLLPFSPLFAGFSFSPFFTQFILVLIFLFKLRHYYPGQNIYPCCSNSVVRTGSINKKNTVKLPDRRVLLQAIGRVGEENGHQVPATVLEVEYSRIPQQWNAWNVALGKTPFRIEVDHIEKENRPPSARCPPLTIR